MQHASKRQLRSTESLPTTAEHYGQKHGIPDDVQAALQNIGRKNRMLVSQGRTFDRTQSFPVFGSSSSFIPDQTLPSGFATNAETYAHAQRLIAREEARQHELQPYSAASSEYGLSPRPEHRTRASPERDIHGRRLTSSGDPAGLMPARSERLQLTPSKKRRPDEGSDTEGDDDVDPVPALEPSHASAQDAQMGEGSESTIHDFPAVFTSPQISQPQLFARPQQMLPSRLLNGRAKKAMPGRTLGKTVSAPVGGLGGWGEMDVDGDADGEDGFDVSEWAASENF